MLTGAGLAAYSGIIQATRISTAADAINDLLAEARADAVTQNITVEVRLYDIPGSADPTPAYRAAQLHWLKPDGSHPAINNPLFLPVSVVFDSTVQHSTLIAGNPITPTADAADPRMNAQTRIFHFLSDGSTDLAPGTSWFLTLRAATQSDPAHFPGNWACVTLDPTTGRAQIFRP